MIRFRRVDPSGPGIFIRLECEYLNREGAVVDRSVSIVGSFSVKEQMAIIRSSHEFHELRLTWTNAYGDFVIQIDQPTLILLSVPGDRVATIGLIAADDDQFSVELEELVNNYDAHREAAFEFSATYARHHSPDRTLERLLGDSVQS